MLDYIFYGRVKYFLMNLLLEAALVAIIILPMLAGIIPIIFVKGSVFLSFAIYASV